MSEACNRCHWPWHDGTQPCPLPARSTVWNSSASRIHGRSLWVAGAAPAHAGRALSHGIDMAVVAAPGRPRASWPDACARWRPHHDREASCGDHRGRAAVATAFEAEGLVGCVGHIERYNPALQQAKA